MNYGILIACVLVLFFRASAQDPNLQNLTEAKNRLSDLSPLLEKGKYENAANLLLNDPQLYNEIWNRVYNRLRQDQDHPLLKNLKLAFKTIQVSDTGRTSLGFTYGWDYDINRRRQSDYERSSLLGKIHCAGNVAFNKKANPNDFQEAKLSIGQYSFAGGAVTKLNAETVQKLNDIKRKLAAIDDREALKNSPLWEEITRAMHITNHYHYSLSAQGGWEGSQDFSQSQLTFGLQGRLSAKAYDNKNTLALLNILDYPFALIRYATGTDQQLTPYGAALPLLTIGLDRVKPSGDSARKALLQHEEAFTRLRFEAGFRTLLAYVGQRPVHFNASYRFFRKLGARATVRGADLDAFSYFTCSLTGNNTYFASYTHGRLPFDRAANSVYAVGFKLNL